MATKGNLPAFLTDDLIVPIKIDVAVKGARYIDSFCYKLFDALMTPEEFAARTCADLNLPDAFQFRIAFQIQEQINSYREIITMLRVNGVDNEKWLKLVSVPLDMMVGLRHNAVDYTDKFTWDLTSTSSGKEPEEFARKTVEDLGLPMDMESAIAYRIRETLLRLIISAAENPDNPEWPFLPSKLNMTSEIVVNLTPPNGTLDMIKNLWTRAKPDSVDTRSAAPQAKLPVNTMTNANTWYSRFVDIEPPSTNMESEQGAMEDDVEVETAVADAQGNDQTEKQEQIDDVNNSQTEVTVTTDGVMGGENPLEIESTEHTSGAVEHSNSNDNNNDNYEGDKSIQDDNLNQEADGTESSGSGTGVVDSMISGEATGMEIETNDPAKEM